MHDLWIRENFSKCFSSLWLDVCYTSGEVEEKNNFSVIPNVRRVAESATELANEACKVE